MYSPYFPGSFGGQMYAPQSQPMFMGGMQPRFQGFQPPPQPPYNPSYNQMYFSQPSLPQSQPMYQQTRPAFQQGGYTTIQQPNFTQQRSMVIPSPTKKQTQVQAPTPSPPPQEKFQPPQTVRVAKPSFGGYERGESMTIQVAKAPSARVISRSNPQILADILERKAATVQEPKVKIAPPQPTEAVRAAPPPPPPTEAVRAAPPPPPPKTPDAPTTEPIIAKATPQDPPLLSVDENGNPKPNKPFYSPILKPSTPTSEVPAVEDRNLRVSFQEEAAPIDRVSRGVCGGCFKDVYNDEKRMKSEDGTYFHSECYNRLAAAANNYAGSPQSM